MESAAADTKSGGSGENPAISAAGSRGGGSAGRERAGQESGRPERELDRGPGGAGGPDRESEHGKAAGPKLKTLFLAADDGLRILPAAIEPDLQLVRASRRFVRMIA